jgi:hypothetical protein
MNSEVGRKRKKQRINGCVGMKLIKHLWNGIAFMCDLLLFPWKSFLFFFFIKIYIEYDFAVRRR